MKVARGAGFKGISVRIWNEGRSAGKFIGADYPHVKHRKCKEAFSHQLSAVSCQPSAFSRTVVLTFGGDATRTRVSAPHRVSAAHEQASWLFLFRRRCGRRNVR